MDRQAYNDLRGWKLPEDENGEDLGYLIEDTASDSNVPGFTGYVSWSPRGLFEKSYGTGVRQAPLTFLDRMKAEHAELVERYNKLTEFTLTPAFKNIPHIEQVDLKEQARHMLKYGLVLGKRIERNSQ